MPTEKREREQQEERFVALLQERDELRADRDHWQITAEAHADELEAAEQQVNELRGVLGEVGERAGSVERLLTGLAGAESADEEHLYRAKDGVYWISAKVRASLSSGDTDRGE